MPIAIDFQPEASTATGPKPIDFQPEPIDFQELDLTSPGAGLPDPGSPDEATLRAQPLRANQIPSAIAQPPSLLASVDASIPSFAPEYRPQTVGAAYREAGGDLGGVINAIDFTAKSPILDERQAGQIVGLAAGPARFAARLAGHADVEKGVEEGLTQQLSGFSTPAAAAQIAALGNPVARVMFAGQILGNIPDDLNRISAAYQSGDKAELGRAIADASMSATMGFMLGKEPFAGLRGQVRAGTRLATSARAAGEPVQGESLADELRRLARTDPEAFRRRMAEEIANRAQGEFPVQAGSGEAVAPEAATEAAGGGSKPTEPITEPAAAEPTAPEPPPPAAEPVQTPGQLQIQHLQERIADREGMLGQLPDDERRTVVLEIQQLKQELHNTRFHEDERQRIENAWQTVSQGSKLRLQGDLRMRGYTEEQISGLTPNEARDILAKPVPPPEEERRLPPDFGFTPPVHFEPTEPAPAAPAPVVDLEKTVEDFGPIERLRAEAINTLGLKNWARGSNFSKANDQAIQAKMLEIAKAHPDFNQLFVQRDGRWWHKATKIPILGPRQASSEGWETNLPPGPTAKNPWKRKSKQEREEEQLRKEYEAEQEAALRGGIGQGPEILDQIIKLGGLPAIGGLHRPAWKGELRRIQDFATGARKTGIKLPKNLFQKSAGGVDRLVLGLRAAGFNIETPQDLFPLLEERIVSNRPHHGQPNEIDEGFGPGGGSVFEGADPYSLEAGARPVSEITTGSKLNKDSAISEYINDTETQWTGGINKAEFERRDVHLSDLESAKVRPLKLSDVDVQEMAGQSYAKGGPVVLDSDLSVIDGMHRIADKIAANDNVLDAWVRKEPDAGSKPAAPAVLQFEPIETDEEMLARQERERQGNEQLQTEAEKKAQLKHGWKQKLTGGTGDLGQRELGGVEAPQGELFEVPAKYSQNPRAIAAAAVVTNDGHIFTGPTHLEAAQAAHDAGYGGDSSVATDDFPDSALGFVSRSGQFLTREGAFKIAHELGQISGRGGRETAGQLEASYFERQQKPTGEETSAFVDSQGVQPERHDEAVNEIQQTLNFANDPRLAQIYPALANVPAGGGKVAPGPGPGDRGARSPAELEARTELARAGFAHLTESRPQDLSRVLRVSKNRISILLPELVKNGQGFNIVGATIGSPADFAMLTRTLRSPFQESFKVAAVNPNNNKVIASEIVSVGTVNETMAVGRDLFRIFAHVADKYPDAELILSHNHPSGRTTPSPSDRQFTQQVQGLAAQMGVKIRDHIITDGDDFFSFADEEDGNPAVHQLPSPLEPWEVLRESGQPVLDSPEAWHKYALTLRNDDPNAAHIFYVGTRYNLRAVERVQSTSSLTEAMMEGIAREGAYGLMIDIATEGPGGMPAMAYAQHLHKAANRMGAKLIDFSTPTTLSAVDAGWINPDMNLPQHQRMQEGQVNEAPASYGASAGAPHRGPTGPRSPAPRPPSSPAIAAAVGPMRAWWKQKTLGFRKVFAPQTIDAAAAMTANAIRHYNARSAQVENRADELLAKARKDFDRTPVPRGWKYTPGAPLPRNYAFIDMSERGGAGLSAADQRLQATIKGIFKQAIDEVHRVDPNALKSLIQDYFPHLWKDPKQAQRVFAEILSHSPLLGTKGFMKQRTLEYFIDGLEKGLEPVSDNPIDLVLTKLHEMNRFVAGKDIMAEMKRMGARRFVYAFERPPEGWRQVDDPTSTVYGPPFVTVPEAYDEQMKVKTVELLNKLGFRHDRVSKLPGQRWGEYHPGSLGAQGPIKTRFAGPLSVYWHELGHGLQERYGWVDQIAHDAKRATLGGRSPIEKELRDLADLRAGGPPGTAGATGSAHFRKYVRTKDEKAAVMLEAYLHAPDAMKNVAPTIYARVRKFIQDHPELHDIERIRPDLVLGSGARQIPVNGQVVLGHWYSPEGAAQVVDNYLSPGLQRFGIMRALRSGSNILNQLQLGFSAFHAGFTTIEQVVSTFAAGINYLAAGHPAKGLKMMAAAPLAPVTKYYTGKAVQAAMMNPKWTGRVPIGPKFLGAHYQLSPAGLAVANQIADLAVKGGLRASTDPFWKTQVTRNFKRAWHAGGIQRWAGTPLRLPFVISEQMMRPILEYLVPRQKLGAFAELAEFYMQRLGPNAKIEDVRAAMARAADAVEDRMGQMTYDNLFYNRVLRDMALLGFRAYGWQLGKYRAIAGGARDLLTTPSRVKAGGEFITPRMAYPIALVMVAAAIGSVMNYLMTGEPPQDWKDMLMPRNGKLGPNGEPQRLSLPTYLKDLLSDWHDFPNLKKMIRSVSHKLNPWLGNAADLINNADFWGTKIYDENDPFLKQQQDKALFILKSATPFSVTGAMRLHESQPSLMQHILPFFGFVPAKRELVMSPAAIRAAELFQETLPRGARRPDQAEHSRMISSLLRDMKEQDPGWQSEMNQQLQAGEFRKGELAQMFRRLPMTPLQYQVKKLDAKAAMEVWDLASPAEREGLRPILIRKVWSSKTLTIPDKVRYNHVLSDGLGAAPAPAAAEAA